MKIGRRRGFTLVEMLVVIGIVAVLAAIVLPVASHTREAGRRTTCQSNLRQIAVAMQQYVQDSNGTYPPLIQIGMVNADNITFSWEDGLAPYLNDRQVFRCVDHQKEIFGERNYTYNSHALNLITREPSIRGKHETRFPHPSTTWLNMDTGIIDREGLYHAGTYIHCRLVPTSSCGRTFFGSTIHSGGGNYSFLDGHVRWFTPEAMAEVDCQNDPSNSLRNN